MKKNIVATVVAMVVLGGIFAAYFYWLHNQPKPNAVQAPSVPTAVSPTLPEPQKPEVSQVIDASPIQKPLPALSQSDSLVVNALGELIANKSLMNLFHAERIIHNVTATIDSLTYRRVPMSVMPIEPPSGKFLVDGAQDEVTISTKNEARYVPYVKLAEAIDPKKLVELYVRLYPLFQQAYEDLGYPGKYFNDRLAVVLDNLLAAPDIKEPVRVTQSTLYYRYADSDLEGRSIGQRILMRLGSKNETRIKAWLQAIKQELKLHMHEKSVALKK